LQREIFRYVFSCILSEQWISIFLLQNIRKTDIACRLGGDESINSVEDMVKRADSAMYQSKKLGGNQYSIFGE